MNRRAIALLCLIATTCAAESRALEQAELKLPITGKKRIVAHYMTGEVFFNGGQVPDNILPAHVCLSSNNGTPK